MSIQQSLHEKKVNKNGINYGSFKTNQFFHKRYDTNINQEFV
jgi:hypothetical protein